jgi:hypothetical protein
VEQFVSDPSSYLQIPHQGLANPTIVLTLNLVEICLASMRLNSGVWNFFNKIVPVSSAWQLTNPDGRKVNAAGLTAGCPSNG